MLFLNTFFGFLKKSVLFILIVAIAIPLRYGSTDPKYLCVRLSVDAIFDGDYEFDIIFVEKCNEKSKIARYEPVGHNLLILAFFITFFNKNYIKFVISVKNCVDCYIDRDVSVQKIL
jgi:hypothetical protein